MSLFPDDVELASTSLLFDATQSQATRRAMRTRLTNAQYEIELVYRVVQQSTDAIDAALLADRLLTISEAIDAALLQLRVPDLGTIPDLDSLPKENDR